MLMSLNVCRNQWKSFSEEDIIIVASNDFSFFFFLRFYLVIRERDRERGRDIGRGRSLAPCREPDAGLNPRTLGSRPKPKADAQPLSHPSVPVIVNSY